ncbi:MAG: YbjQ family protein, partial [Acidimicrobiales bacterium]
DIGASLKSLVGGELKSYSDMLVDARAQAMARMETQAAEMGADAIVNLRLTTSQVVGGAAELLAYGTAVTTEAE